MSENSTNNYSESLSMQAFKGHWQALKEAFAALPLWERYVHAFWLSGPFILLIERSPADAWLSIISMIFLAKMIVKREGWWLKVGWVKLTFAFWAACLISAALSPLPIYSLGETLIWFRFPIFAMAVAFWLGRNMIFVYAMLISIGFGLVAMVGIGIAEVLIVGQQSGRLSWPYGDLVPGNYLAKACLPAFVVLVALATSAKGKLAGPSALLALISIVASIMTGERINFLIRACSGMIAAVVWKPRPFRVLLLLIIEGGAILATMIATPSILDRFYHHFIAQLPTQPGSEYFKAMMAGWVAFLEAPLTGIGPGNLRLLCGQLPQEAVKFTCHPHPHNYYFQMLGEVGIVGLLTGVLFLGSIIWACAKPALRDRNNVVVATMWIIPFAFFWPIASTADFFGQWNNIFMWSAVAVALAGAQIGSRDRSDAKS